MNLIEYYAAADKLYSKLTSKVCAKYNLTYMELNVLLFLANNNDYDTATEIVRYRHLSKSHVSVSVRSLSEKGLLISEYRDNNRRTVHLIITEKAAEIIKEGRNAQNLYFKILTSGFTDEEKESLSFLIKKIDCNMKNYMNKEEIKEND